MNTVVFDPKGKRFIASGPFDEDMPNIYVMIVDYKFWTENERDIYAWMEENLPRGRLHQTGMVVELAPTDATAFLLRWA